MGKVIKLKTEAKKLKEKSLTWADSYRRVCNALGETHNLGGVSPAEQRENREQYRRLNNRRVARKI